MRAAPDDVLGAVLIARLTAQLRCYVPEPVIARANTESGTSHGDVTTFEEDGGDFASTQSRGSACETNRTRSLLLRDTARSIRRVGGGTTESPPVPCKRA